MSNILILVLYGKLLAQRGMHGWFGSSLSTGVVNCAPAFIKPRCLEPGRDRGSSESLQLLEKFMGQRQMNGESRVHITCMFVQSIIV